MKYQFSGHDSFICKHFWLKKGYDFVKKGGSFSDDSSVIDLGVGKNMVTSISFWLRSYGMIDSNQKISEIAQFLFHDKNGVDPYIENISSVWLLHYHLVKTNKASIYNLFFNEFRKGRTDFTKEQLASFVKRTLINDNQKNFTANTINADISVFIRNYLRPSSRELKLDIEEDFSSLMIDLELITSYKAENSEGKLTDWYKIENKNYRDLPPEIILFSILDNEKYGKSIPFKELLVGFNSPGAIFALNEDGLFNKIEQLVKKFKGITYSESAGVRELQLKTKQNKWDILNAYYKD